jgi:uncharacterized protein
MTESPGNTPAFIFQTIAGEIGAQSRQVAAAAELLDDGATVPFVARYRKEATGGLDDTQLRNLAERLTYLRELEARREAIVDSIRSQGKLTDELSRSIALVKTKSELEDIYLPYKPKRRTKAMIARENGLEPLLDAILSDRSIEPETLASGYINETVPTPKEALNGARDILMERLSENATLLGELRAYMKEEAFMTSTVVPGQEDKGAKFSDYFDHKERWKDVASHRALAMLRASNEEVVTLNIAPEKDVGSARASSIIAGHIGIAGAQPGDRWLKGVAEWTWTVKLSTTMFIDLLGELRARAHDEAITVFARNLKNLLLAAPAGPRPVMGLDPGIRTGVKVAVVDATGRLIATDTIYPFQPKNDVRGAQASICRLMTQHKVELIAIGNGTASRETERFVADTLALLPKEMKAPTKVIVSEAGASVYSASELGAREFPELDVSLRGAVSIARRLQDPLAELVKIEPKSIGVGQYQHDVDQFHLARSLEAVVEDAVNAVGVDLNTASAPLLAYVSGLGQSLAEAVVEYRHANGAFRTRRDLLKVPRLGPRAFEQSAGFLRIRDGDEPLDSSAVHPEAYGVARRIIASCGRDIRSLMGDAKVLRTLNPATFVDEHFGLPTVKDILSELEKPGRDPRPGFKTASFADGIETMKDLKPGMQLEGTVTNVAAFGAFVDIGVHQDGLVHVSQLADRFIKDPHDVVKAGDIVKVRVLDIDLARNRISLTMRKEGGLEAQREAASRNTNAGASKQPKPKQPKPPASSSTGSLGAALRDALDRRGN